MDTISRENNSMLPVGSIILGVVALLLGGFALVQASKANKLLTEQQAKIDRIESVEQQVAAANQNFEQARRDTKSLEQQTQNAFNQVSNILAEMRTSVTKLEDAAKKPAVAASTKKGGGAPAVPGPDEYVIKKGDYPAKIAKELGISSADIVAVNPGVNWNKLAIGSKIKLPAKK